MDNRNTGRRREKNLQDLALLLAVFCGSRDGGTHGDEGRVGKEERRYGGNVKRTRESVDRHVDGERPMKSGNKVTKHEKLGKGIRFGVMER